MGQYRLWLQHRAIDQNLRTKHTAYTQKLSEIDEHIASLEQIAMPTNNVLVTTLMQLLKRQEQTTTQITEIAGAQPEQNDAPQKSANSQNHQTPPPPTYGQQNTSISPALFAEGNRPNFSAQNIYGLEETPPSDTTPASPEATDGLPSSDLNTQFAQKSQENALPPLPWWLRDLMQPIHEVPETQQTAPIDQQSIHTNKRVEHWFARRTRLIHYDE